MKKNDVK